MKGTMDSIIIYFYNKQTEKINKITLKDLLNDLEKSSTYPFRSGFKFFFSEDATKKYKKEYEKWVDKL